MLTVGLIIHIHILRQTGVKFFTPEKGVTNLKRGKARMNSMVLFLELNVLVWIYGFRKMDKWMNTEANVCTHLCACMYLNTLPGCSLWKSGRNATPVPWSTPGIQILASKHRIQGTSEKQLSPGWDRKYKTNLEHHVIPKKYKCAQRIVWTFRKHILGLLLASSKNIWLLNK